MHLWIGSSLDQRADRATQLDRNKTRLEVQHDSWFLQRILWSYTTRKDTFLYWEEFHPELSRSIWLERKIQGHASNKKHSEFFFGDFTSRFHECVFICICIVMEKWEWVGRNSWGFTGAGSAAKCGQPCTSQVMCALWYCVFCVFSCVLCILWANHVPPNWGVQPTEHCFNNVQCLLLQMMTRCILQIIKPSVRTSPPYRWLGRGHCVFLIFSCY